MSVFDMYDFDMAIFETSNLINGLNNFVNLDNPGLFDIWGKLNCCVCKIDYERACLYPF